MNVRRGSTSVPAATGAVRAFVIEPYSWAKKLGTATVVGRSVVH